MSVTWTVHPARRRPFTAVVVVVLVCGLAAIGGSALGDGYAWTSWLFAILLLTSISGFLLPTTYTVDDEGIAVRHALTTRRRLWKDIRRVEIGARAALLSPFAEPRTLDRWRALLVHLEGAPAEARDALSAHRTPGSV
jgi:hypothetical protein